MIIWRKITEMQFYRERCKPGYGSYSITLDCGHTVGRKKSECKTKYVGSKMRCHECQSQANKP